MKKLYEECKDPVNYWFKNWVKANKKSVDLKCKIDKACYELQKLIDDVNTKTIINVGQFISKLEVIQDELMGDAND